MPQIVPIQKISSFLKYEIPLNDIVKKLSLLAVAIAVLFTISVSLIGFTQTADALKSKGNSLPETGSKRVCGDRLCTHMDYQHQMKSSGSMMNVDSMDINTMIERMNKVHENHQQQMIQFWNSMTPQEQSQMYQNMQKMIEVMESMTMQQHMQMMSYMESTDMQQYMNSMPYMDSTDMQQHMNAVPYMGEKYHDKTMQHLATFDELDFDVFTNQKWDRLKESHSQDIVVHWPDGSKTVGIERHIEDLKSMFVYAPDTRIEEHPVKIASGEWTSVIGVMEGTFTEPMPLPDGTVIEPTGKSFKIQMTTVGHWKDGVMDEEYLFWDNLAFMKQIGLG